MLGIVAFGIWGSCVAAEDAQRQLEDVARQLNALDTWLDDAGKRLAEQQGRLAAADRGIAAAAQRIRALDDRIESGKATLDELAGQREDLRQERGDQAARIADHLRHAWQFTDRDFLKTLLGEEDPARFERMVRYHGALARARVGAVAEFLDTMAALAENERRVQAEQRSARQTHDSLQEERAALLAERNRRRGLIAGLRTDVADRSREREELAASRERLQALVDELARREQPASSSASVTAAAGLGEGDLPWPVQGRVHRRFGEARAGGRMTWQGMVIQAALGTDVRAVAAGRVVFADWLRGFGLLAIVDHGDGYMSLYGYADTLYKRAGDHVEGGESIAAAGQSGGQQEVGLYFEMRKAGKPIDPNQWLLSRAE